jgi:hypothetical protein
MFKVWPLRLATIVPLKTAKNQDFIKIACFIIILLYNLGKNSIYICSLKANRRSNLFPIRRPGTWVLAELLPKKDQATGQSQSNLIKPSQGNFFYKSTGTGSKIHLNPTQSNLIKPIPSKVGTARYAVRAASSSATPLAEPAQITPFAKARKAIKNPTQSDLIKPWKP